MGEIIIRTFFLTSAKAYSRSLIKTLKHTDTITSTHQLLEFGIDPVTYSWGCGQVLQGVVPIAGCTRGVTFAAHTAMGCQLLGAMFYLVILALLVPLSQQVQIKMTDDMFLTWSCTDIAPGVCCGSPRSIQAVPHVTFYQLSALDVAAVWETRKDDRTGSDIGACSGRVRDSRLGPGWWDWHAMSRYSASTTWAAGASYITIPTSLPPDPPTVVSLGIQGILGLVWGGGSWFASPAVEKYLSRSHPMKRDIRSPEKGDVLASSPRRRVYPDLVKINGTDYVSDGVAGEFMYKDSKTEEVRNLTWLFI